MITRTGLLEGRIIYGEVSDYSEILPLYQSLVDYFLREEQLSPELVVYSSYNKLLESKYVEEIVSKETKAFLLLDMHLLDILGEFTESYLEDKNYAELTRRLTFRVLAESKGAFLAIQSMQLLSFADKYTDVVLNFQDSNQIFYFEMNLRMIIYKTHLSKIYCTMTDKSYCYCGRNLKL